MRTASRLFVTGGAGFIGSAFIRFLLRNTDFSGYILNYDLLTYAANLDYLRGFMEHPRHRFVQGDIKNQTLVAKLIVDHEIDTIVHFAAETHVDRSIDGSRVFIETNVLGTLSLLEVVRGLPHIHFHHISTDEVFGSLGEGGVFYENSPYRPNSPYAASKASSDHLVRSFGHTYGLSTTISHCGNNYGPCQYPEKFVPLMIHNSLYNKPLPIYGNGRNIRDWIYVDDHVAAVWEIVCKGRKGESYNIGSQTELSNLDMLHKILDLLHSIRPGSYKELIRFVTDRKGHDFRYALDTTKIKKEMDWYPKIGLQEGLQRTIHWYVN